MRAFPFSLCFPMLPVKDHLLNEERCFCAATDKGQGGIHICLTYLQKLWWTFCALTVLIQDYGCISMGYDTVFMCLFSLKCSDTKNNTLQIGFFE